MMRILFLSLFCMGMIQASPISTPLLDTNEDRGTIQASQLKVGMSGFIVRHFDDKHSSIIANARVSTINADTNRAQIDISPYDGLRQNSLPSGKWTVKANDEVVMAYDYERALLIAPNLDTYNTLSGSIPNVEWVHPDTYATYLSHEGHPTPLVKDFHQFCTANSIGLLYIQSADTLFTLDCKNFALLETRPALSEKKEPMTPFYTRVPAIRANWFGEGSSRLKSYEPYYLEEIALKNSKNKELHTLYKAKFSENSALLRNFNVKE
ncbi:MAG: plasminogen-binding N-terminal domain-containing protein [Sulfuricurvum sp.]|nr:plasminogen-binding N-terminal domain-containing protein [Sulfuricurvum sp.]